MRKMPAPWILVSLCLLIGIVPTFAHFESVQYPIAALSNRNVWLYTLDGQGLQLTKGGGFKNLIWSPDGKVLAFLSSSGVTPPSIYISNSSGQEPVELVSGVNSGFPVSFSPAGQLVYGLLHTPDPTPDDPGIPIDVYQINPTAGAVPEFLGSFSYAAGCGGGADYDPSLGNYLNETNQIYYPKSVLSATPWGIVHNAECGNDWSLSLLTTERAVSLGTFISQDRSQFFTHSSNGVIPIINGELSTEIATPAEPDRIGFGPTGSADIFYSSRKPLETITLPENILEAFRANSFDPEPARYSVSVHRLNLTSGKDTQLYESTAYGIGNIYGLSDGSGIVFSLIPNPDEWVQALVNGIISLDDIAVGEYHRDEYSKVELMYLDFSTVQTRVIGTNLNNFVLNTVSSKGANAILSTVVPSLTLVVNEVVRTNPEITAANVRATPDTSAAVVEILAGNTSLTIIEGPIEAGGYRWWRVKLPSTAVGWIAERVGDTQILLPP